MSEHPLYPPAEMFEDNGKGLTQRFAPTESGQLTSSVTHIHFPTEGGVWVYHQGDKYPHRAWPFKEAVFAMDTIKRAVNNLGLFFARFPYLLLPFFILPRFVRQRIERYALVLFGDYTENVITRWGVKWKPQYFCDFVRELWRVGIGIAGDDPSNIQCVRAACMFMEFDDAYRYFVQDGFEQLDQAALIKDPGRELARVLMIMSSRADTSLVVKFAKLARLVKYLMWLPEARQLARQFARGIEVKKCHLDEADWYRCLLWGNYKFRGVPAEQRVSLRMMMDAEWQVEMKKAKIGTVFSQKDFKRSQKPSKIKGKRKKMRPV